MTPAQKAAHWRYMYPARHPKGGRRRGKGAAMFQAGEGRPGNRQAKKRQSVVNRQHDPLPYDCKYEMRQPVTPATQRKELSNE